MSAVAEVRRPLRPPHRPRTRWAARGDINAFFGLMLDNVVNLAVLAGILVAGFGFPATLVYTRMFPGTALGVMFGDIVYTVMAIRLARRTGRDDVTAMPLGLDAPSTIGMALTVLGPAFLVAKTRMPDGRRGDRRLAGRHGDDGADGRVQAHHVVHRRRAFAGRFPRRVSSAPSAASGIALLGTLQLGEIYGEPIVGMMALGVIIYALVAKIRLPFRAPEVLASVVARRRALLRARRARAARCTMSPSRSRNFPLGLPLPSLGFLARDADRGARLHAARACRSRFSP